LKSQRQIGLIKKSLKTLVVIDWSLHNKYKDALNKYQSIEYFFVARLLGAKSSNAWYCVFAIDETYLSFLPIQSYDSKISHLHVFFYICLMKK